MPTAVNRASPTLGMALGYFLVLFAVLQGHIPEQHQPEAVAMAGVVATNLIMEFKGFLRWVGSLIKKEDKPGGK